MKYYSSLIYLVFVFTSVCGIKDWKRHLWENGMKTFTRIDDPYGTLKQIVGDLEKEDGEQVESYVNEIFLRVLLASQGDQTQNGGVASQGNHSQNGGVKIKTLPAELTLCKIIDDGQVKGSRPTPSLGVQIITPSIRSDNVVEHLGNNTVKVTGATNSTKPRFGMGARNGTSNDTDVSSSSEDDEQMKAVLDNDVSAGKTPLFPKFGFAKLFNLKSKKTTKGDLGSKLIAMLRNDSDNVIPTSDTENNKNDTAMEDYKTPKTSQNGSQTSVTNDTLPQGSKRNLIPTMNGRKQAINETDSGMITRSNYIKEKPGKNSDTVEPLISYQRHSNHSTTGKYSSRMKFIVDTDCNKDNAIALLVILGAEGSGENVSLNAITTVNCETSSKAAADMVFSVLKTMNRRNIPIYEGEDSPLIALSNTSNLDSSEELSYPTNFSSEIPKQSKKSFEAMTQLTKENSGKISLIFLGPLTNLALAIKFDEQFLNNVGNIFILGGNLNKNSSPQELNFRWDPIAAQVVFAALRERSKPTVTVFPWEPYESQLPSTACIRMEDYSEAGSSSPRAVIGEKEKEEEEEAGEDRHDWQNRLGKLSSPAISLMKQLKVFSLPYANSTFYPTALVALATKQLSADTKKKSVSVDICSENRGAIEFPKDGNGINNINIVSKIYPSTLPKLITKALTFIASNATT